MYSKNTPLRSQAPGREGQKELGELYMATWRASTSIYGAMQTSAQTGGSLSER